jgi:hypothetical protein
VAVRVILATAIAQIELMTGGIGEKQLTRIIIDQFIEAAFAAAVTQTFPLCPRHLTELGGLPEG